MAETIHSHHTEIQPALDPSVPDFIAQDSNESRKLVSDIWRRSIDLAIRQNKDLAGKGIYTEIHQIGKGILPMPALASTDYFANDSGIGYVDVKGGGHTLAEIYAFGGLPPRPGHERIDESIFQSDIAKLTRLIGMERRGTLLKRCLTRLDDNKQPIIHILPRDMYNTTRRAERLDDSAIIYSLEALGIQSVLDKEPAREATPASIDVKESELVRADVAIRDVVIYRYREPAAAALTDQLAVLSSASFGPDGRASLEFVASRARLHRELYGPAHIDENDGWVHANLHGQHYALRVLFARKQSQTIWQVVGELEQFRAAWPQFQEIVQEAGNKLARHVSDGDTPRKVRHLLEVVDSTVPGSREIWDITLPPDKE